MKSALQMSGSVGVVLERAFGFLTSLFTYNES